MPSILTDPQASVVFAGSNATFSVLVDGTAPLFYQWLFNQTNVIAGATNNSLTLTSVGYEKAGGYSVLVTNAFGSATSAVAVLQVAQPLTVSVRGRGSVSLSPSQPSYAFAQTVTLTATADRYYKFLLWSDGNTNNPRAISITASNNLFIAIFTNTVPLELHVLKQWERDYGGTSDDFGYQIRQTADGGFILGGSSASAASGNKYSTNYGGQDMWLIKLDAFGDKQWERSFGGGNDDVLNSLEQTSDGGFIFGGYSASAPGGNKTSPNYGSFDYWVVRTDANGNKLWEQSFGGSGDDKLYTLRQTSDGGFILGGDSTSGPGGNKTSPNYGNLDYWVVRIDADGNKLWDQSFGGSGIDELRILQQTADGGFILGGDSLSGISGNKTTPVHSPGQDDWVVKIDANGNKQWENSFAIFRGQNILSLQETGDGGFILGGAFAYTSMPQDFSLLRLDANGNIIWDYAFGGSAYDVMTGMAVAREGGFFMGGISASPAGGGNKTAPNYGGGDYWVVKADDNGNIIWDYAFGGVNDEELYGLQQTSDGGLIVAGQSLSAASGNKTTPNYGGYDFWVVKLSNVELPVGTPVVLVNGLFAISNSFTFTETNAAAVTLQTFFANGAIRYTFDGSAPTTNSPLYTGTFVITNTASVTRTFLLQAVAWNSNFTASATCDPVPVSFVPRVLHRAQQGRGSVSASPSQTAYALGQTVVLTPTPQRYYQFLRWSDGNTNNPRTITIGASNNLFTAIFTNAVPLELHVLKQWERSYGGTSDDQLTAAKLTPDGGFILGGHSASPPGPGKTATNYGGFDYWIVKCDAFGKSQWERTFGGAADDFLQDIALVNDGGYLLAGVSQSGNTGNKSAGNYGGSDAWVVRIDANGNKLWDQTYGGSGVDEGFCAIATADGGFLIGGDSASPQGSGNKTSPGSSRSSTWVFKLDANGNKQWDQSYGVFGGWDAASFLNETSGGYFLGGVISSGCCLYLGWAARVDKLGNLISENTFGGTAIVNSGVALPDGGAYLVGYRTLPDSDYWLQRLDSFGNTLDSHNYNGGSYDRSHTVVALQEGGFLLGGESRSGIGGLRTYPNYGDTDYWILRLNEQGEKFWDLALGGSGSEYLDTVLQTPDGGFLLAGYSDSGTNAAGGKTLPNIGGVDFWVVKLSNVELPVGTPVVLVNGLYGISNTHTFTATNPIQVELRTTFTNGFIFYTENGDEPDAGELSFLYDVPFTVTQSVTIRAIAYDELFDPPGALADPVTITVLPLYPLTVTTPGGGSITPNPPTGPYPSNSVVVLTATAQPGWSFMRWEGDVNGTESQLSLTINQSNFVRAVFGTLLATTNTGGGSVLRNPPQGPYPYGSSVRLSGAPDAGKFFLRWAGAISAVVSPVNVTITNANQTVNGVFGSTTNRVLTVLINGDGGVTKSPQAGTYLNGSAVTLTATPAQASFFAGWSGDASGGSTNLVVVMNTNKVITANFAGTPTNFPPVLSIVAPSNGVTFASPADIIIAVNASDAGGSVSAVDFFAGTNLIGSVSQPPFNFAWTNVPIGTYALTARAVDNLSLATVSAPVQVTVAAPAPAPPVFQFSSTTNTVGEGDGLVTVTVLKSGSATGSVSYATADGNARAGASGSGDYQAASGSLSFAGNESSKTISIQIYEDTLVEGTESFTISLTAPGVGGVLGTPSTATIQIQDNDTPPTDSFLLTKPPDAIPDRGYLRVQLEPAAAFGQWRFVWDRSWRDGGVLVPGLPSGNYEVEFKPVSGYSQPANQIVPVPANALTVVTNLYVTNGVPHTGSLTVEISPDSMALNAQPAWRRQGETNWHGHGETISGLPSGVQIIEFTNITGWATPPPQAHQVVADQRTIVNVTYLIDQPGPGTPTSVQQFVTVTDAPYFGLPFGFCGQISSAVGFGSGFVVKERVVLTAAHVVFNDALLSYVSDVRWFYQRHRGEYEPRPQTPRGWYVSEGYAAQRTSDNTPGVSTPPSQNLDVAALYFLESAGRGGFGGYLTSDAVANEWLTGSRPRYLIGYPVEDVPESDQGRLHSVGPFTSGLTKVVDQVYATTAVRAFPGNSGGPLCVLHPNGTNYPAAIFLGGSNQTIVRAIDSTVVDFIHRAEVSANAGGDSAGGGVILLSLPVGQSGVGYLRVNLGPPAAIAAGGAWRASPTNHGGIDSAYTSFQSNSPTITVTLDARHTNFAIELRPIPGFNPPTNRPVTIVVNDTVPLDLLYTPVLPPLLSIARTNQTFLLTLSGSPGTAYRVEQATAWKSTNWSLFSNVNLVSGSTSITAALATNGTSRFFRATSP